MDLLQLRYFCYAAKVQSFAEAAKHFRVPPSGISQSVKRLESELGCPLFDRSSNRIRLNESGTQFYRKAEEALSILDNAKKSLQFEEKSVLRVLVENNRRPVTLAVEEFSKTHPYTSFSLDYRPKEGETYDVVISDRAPKEGSYEALPLITEPFALAMRKDHPLAHHTSLHGELLKKERFVCMPKGHSLYDVLISFGHSHGFTPTLALESDDPDTVRHCIESGVGVGLVPAFSWKGSLSSQVCLIPVIGLTRTTHVYYEASAPLSAEKEAFLATVQAVFRQADQRI